MASKMSQHLINNELETKCTKNVENVFYLTPLDLQETRFRMERLSRITKTRSADKYKQISKNCVKMKPKSMENRSRNSTKNDASKQSPNNQKILQKWLQNCTQIMSIFWGKCLLWRFGGSKPFLWSKSGPPALQKCPQGSKNKPKMTQKKSPSAKMSSKSRPFSEPSENDLQKWTLFGSRSGGLREALTMYWWVTWRITLNVCSKFGCVDLFVAFCCLFRCSVCLLFGRRRVCNIEI